MKFRLRDDRETRPEWTPLIGVVLLLFALIAVASHLGLLTADERTRLPQLALARPPISNPAAVTLDIVHSTMGDSGGWTVVSSGREWPLTEIEPELRRLARRRGDVDGPIVIRAEETVPHGVLQQVVQASQAAGFARFALKPLLEPRVESKEPRTE